MHFIVKHRNHTAIAVGRHMFIKSPSGETVAKTDDWNYYGDPERELVRNIDDYLRLEPFLREGWGSGKWGTV